jgi:hypothetical protein
LTQCILFSSSVCCRLLLLLLLLYIPRLPFIDCCRVVLE